MSLENKTLVGTVIQQRRTHKVLAEQPLPVRDCRREVEELMAEAGWAPFHKPAAEVHRVGHGLQSIVPWRFYALDGKACRRLRSTLVEAGNKTKIPQMLATADALIQVTWLPNSSTEARSHGADGDDFGVFEPTLQNMEHIAAASAAIQNLLLAATARDFRNYWSSGGVLRSSEIFELLDIPLREILLGSIFLFPGETGDAIVRPGAHRDNRGDLAQWSRWIDLDGQD